MLVRRAHVRAKCGKAAPIAMPSPARRRRAVRVAAGAGGADRAPRAENVPGDFFVDHTCIDCATCRWVAPDVFKAVNGAAAVTAQPQDEAGRVTALQALLSCPTYSIHAVRRDAAELRSAQDGLPRPWPAAAPGVFHCGWHSQDTYGGAAWLIQRPGGNVLVDCPRFNPVLARRIQELGGIKYIFLTHRDDVAGHDRWAAHFGAARVIHEREAAARQGTDKAEVKLAGAGPWALPDGGGDVQIIRTPGHTADHLCLLSRPHRALFTGDHLCAHEGPGGVEPGRLAASREFNWYSWDEQVRSIAALADLDFVHVLPGHGPPARLEDEAHRRRALQEVVVD